MMFWWTLPQRLPPPTMHSPAALGRRLSGMAPRAQRLQVLEAVIVTGDDVIDLVAGLATSHTGVVIARQHRRPDDIRPVWG